MCGISGIINFNSQKVSKNSLQTMMSKMEHRGPDDDGMYLKDNIGLGFVRLSILDLSKAGHQPMFSHDKRYVIIFNGEVYNYLELKDKLNHKYNFHSGTDTEVILAAYQEWGNNFLEKCNGMFSLCILDTKTNNIFCARDRFGIKPFYYYHDDDKFIFASEIKSILPLLKNKNPKNEIICDYLLHNRTDHTEFTFFDKIKKLQHGHYLEIKDKNIKFYKWYNLSEKLNNGVICSVSKYRDLFKQSIKLRLRADVPIGVSLSGGIDSSSIVSCLYNDFKIKDLNTFSAIFGKNEKTDESEYINSYVDIIDNMHYTSPDANSFYDDFEEFIEAHNEPVPDTGPYAQYKVMQLASKYVTVTLDGQGADEQLAGYHYFFGSYYIELLKKMRLLKFLNENIKYFYKHKTMTSLKFMAYYLLPLKMQMSVNKNILYKSVKNDFVSQNKNKFNINQMLYKPKSLNESLFQHFEYKLEHLLKWEDLNSMHFSIESRVPFLDHNLVESTLSTPSKQKINNAETKYLLREAMKDILPKKIINRKDKKGFSNPRDKWLRSVKFKNYIYDIINSEKFKSRGYFDSTIANRIYKNHLAKNIDASKEIWKWINLEVWFNKFLD